MANVKNSDKIKAAFLMHFTGYTTWPGNKLNEVNICLLGDVSFDNFLKSMIKAKPQNRTGQQLNLFYLEKAEDIDTCQVAFVGNAHVEHVVKYRQAKQLPVLLVGGGTGFIERGGMISFFQEEQRIRFKICPEKLAQANIKMSAELLRLAVIYHAHHNEEVAP
ncbi:YfiR family protein [Thalassotalea sp. LPB0316]|uniref:YfiR family protein n=1 Tax=Thalassotalea sp. LPB0316 TaxID=2769490 RepID=UPI001869411A|nr:YfiR family protein [Thalassotalea sp. LPB0316]QOL24754.1 YfiR family protein [Thalassotalea sp. LPB0316]